MAEDSGNGTSAAAPAQTILTRVHGSIGVIRINNPPVNALSHRVRSGLLSAVQSFSEAREISSIVIVGHGRTFSAGADIREFGKPIEEPQLNALNRVIEDCRKPTIAAIHGTALGGGLELAMACHFRIATASARLGLPEVKLGLIPGAGGTQRLPRLIGTEKALEAVVKSRLFGAAAAKHVGLIDEVVQDDIEERATDFANLVVSEARELRLARNIRETTVPDATFTEFEGTLSYALKKRFAASRAIRSIRNAVDLPFDEALEKEREYVAECKASPQSDALRYVFFAERAAAKFDGYVPGAIAGGVKTVAIAGTCPLRLDLATMSVRAGIRVVLFDEDPRSLSEALRAIRLMLERRMPGHSDAFRRDLNQSWALLEGTTELESVQGAEMAFEVADEVLDRKMALVSRLSRLLDERAVIVTTTAFFDVARIAAASIRPGNVVGLHFFIPPQTMRQVEVVRTSLSSNLITSAAVDLSKRLGKVPVVVRDCDGFAGDRTFRSYLEEALTLSTEGVPAARIDAAMRDFGMAMGPFELCHFIGFDLAQRILDGRNRSSRPGSTAKLHELVQAGIAGGSAELPATARSAVDDHAIVDRCLLAAAEAGSLLVSEGMVSRSSDIDVVWVNGLGFPDYAGGPMFRAEAKSSRQVVFSDSARA